MLKEQIAVGGQSVLYRASAEDNQNAFVIKLPRPDLPLCPEALQREAELSARARNASPQFAYLSFSADPETGAAVIAQLPEKVMSLRSFRAAPVQEEDPVFADLPRVAAALELTESLLNAIGQLHEKGILHCDLSPGNVQVDSTDRKVYVIDFGSARMIGETAHGVPTTYDFASPEVRHQDGELQPKCDIYSIAALLIYLCVKEFKYLSRSRELPPLERKTDFCGWVDALRIPSSVKDLLKDVLVKALSSRVYKACGEMQLDLKKIKDAIHNKGMDLESIRAVSRRRMEAEWKTRLANFDADLLRPFTDEDGEVDDEIVCEQNCLLIAEGGSGKTTRLLQLWKEMHENQEQFGWKVPLFIQVAKYDGDNISNCTTYIEESILRNYVDWKNTLSGKESWNPLDVLSGHAVLLIDGLNEAKNTYGLLSEIADLSEAGFLIIVSSRSSVDYRPFSSYKMLTLPLLSADTVTEKIGSSILQPRLAEALRLPFFLVKFLNLAKKEQQKIASPGELLLAERDRLIEQLENSGRRDVNFERAILVHVLPAFAYYAGRVALTNKMTLVTLRKACKKVAEGENFRYRERMLGLAGGTDEELFSIVDRIFITFGVLRCDGDESGYIFTHQSLLDFYAAVFLNAQMHAAKPGTCPDCLESWIFDEAQARYLGEIFKNNADATGNIHSALANWMQSHLRSQGHPLAVRKIVETMKLLNDYFSEMTFAGLNLTQTDFYGSTLHNCDFSGSLFCDNTFIASDAYALNDIDVSADGRVQLKISGFHNLVVVKDGVTLESEHFGPRRFCSAKLFPDGSAYLTYDEANNVLIHKISPAGNASDKIVLHFQIQYSDCIGCSFMHGDGSSQFAISKDCHTIAAEQFDAHLIQIWHLENGLWNSQCVIRAKSYSAQKKLAISADGRYLFVIDRNTIYGFEASKQGEIVCEPVFCHSCMPDSFSDSCDIVTRVLAVGTDELLITYKPIFVPAQAPFLSISREPLWCGFAVFDFLNFTVKYYPNVLQGFNPITCAAVLSPGNYIFGSKKGQLLVVDTTSDAVSVQKHLERDDLPALKRLVCAYEKNGPVVYGYWEGYTTPFSYSIQIRQLSLQYEKPLFCTARSIDNTRFITGNEDGDITLWESQEDLSLHLVERKNIWPAPTDIFLPSQNDYSLVKQLDGTYSRLSYPPGISLEVSALSSGCPYGHSEKDFLCGERCHLAASRLSFPQQSSLCHIGSSGQRYHISWGNHSSGFAKAGFIDQLSVLREDMHQCQITFGSRLFEVLLLPKRGLLACVTANMLLIIEIESGKVIFQQFHRDPSASYTWGELSASPDESVIFWPSSSGILFWQYEALRLTTCSFEDNRITLAHTVPPLVTDDAAYFVTKDNCLAVFSLKENLIKSKYSFPDAIINNCRFARAKNIYGDSSILSNLVMHSFGTHGVVVTDFSTCPIHSYPVKHIYLLNIEQTNGARFISLPSTVLEMLGTRKYIATEKYRNVTWIMSKEELTLWNGKPWSDGVFDAGLSDGRIKLPDVFSACRQILLHIRQTGAWFLQSLEESDDIIEYKSNL